MRIYPRYLLRQYLIPLVVSWGVLTGIFLMDRLFLLFDLIIRKGVEVQYVGEILLFSLPFVLAMSVPLAALAGAMMTFGRLAQDNEIMALRSGGVRLFSIFLPVMGFTFLLAVAMVFFNLFILPESNHRVRNLLSDVSSKKPTVRLEEGEFNDEFPGYSIYIGRKDDRTSRIYDVKISIKSRRGHSFIFSPEGTIDVTPDETYMQMVLYSSEVHEQIDNNYRRIFTDTQTINLPLNTDLIRRERTYRSEREMTLPMLVENIEKQEEKLEEYEEALVKAPNQVKRKEYESRIDGVNKKINGMKVEIHKSIAFALAGIIFLCFGSALGGKLRKGGIGLSIVLSLVFFAFYYVLLIGGESLAKNGKIAAWLAMWLPNFIFLPFTAEVFGEVFFESSLVLWRLRR